jgi:hypothetical protein
VAVGRSAIVRRRPVRWRGAGDFFGIARSVGWVCSGSCTGSEPPIPIKAPAGVWITGRGRPSHIRLTDCADGGGLEALPWDYCLRQRRRRDLLAASSPTGGQGVAGSNPVVPTA